MKLPIWYRDGNRRVLPADAENANVPPSVKANIAHSDSEAAMKNADLVEPVKPGAAAAPPTLFGKMKKAALHGVTFDIHEVIEEDKQLSEMHSRAEVFQPRIEMSFSYLQVRPQPQLAHTPPPPSLLLLHPHSLFLNITGNS